MNEGMIPTTEVSFIGADYDFLQIKRYTNADLKISLYVCVNIKAIPSKFRIPNPKNYRVFCA